MLESIRYTVIHTFLSMYPLTYMEDPMELERGVTTTTMARDLPHLNVLASLLNST